ncbi:class I SAM-dependent methyltransferase [Halobacillus sp. ACCC02827]|uniref:class I SAM-dependent methyltransferase n=1 Tax=Bacillaceae TaxID=186817 RepID=UPI0002A5000F|nr:MULTISPECIES: class I SAM-dependent methyltransferase [Bacillaceae]ELK47310.1 putative DNA-methyltransferase [Halobacillus sp. BAB-2008]QHT47423.1 class I SAM-dependent methyltransferase [Bacillus sp. SB49]WJE14647.1 class I SAM-dependent methyltransferase [Halobacillus sp. ACCC02827]
MKQAQVEKLFQWVDDTATTISEDMNITYLEAIAETMDVLFNGKPFDDMGDSLQTFLTNELVKVKKEDFEKEEVRKAVQLAILKGMKGATQQQHLITPDSVAMFLGYLATKLFDGEEALKLFDPAAGSGNLLTSVMNQLGMPLTAYASEVDPTLVQLAVANANLQENEIEFFHQDSLKPFLMEPVDLVLADLPVGYYPDDVNAERFELQAEEGHSYAHHLFIEQGMSYTKDGGYLMFIVPNFLFDSDQSKSLNAYLREHAHIVGMLQLSDSLFKDEKHGKSILILQKKGKETKAPKQALLAKLPSFKNPNAMADILSQMNGWFDAYKAGEL